MPPTKTSIKPSKSKVREPEGPKVLYPTILHELMADREEADHPPIDILWAKERLGWREVVKDAGPFLFKDVYGTRIALDNNDINRPYQHSWAEILAQEILQGNWRLNGESIIIGKTGKILSSQHRLVALVLACQLWEKKKNHWGEMWDHPPTFESIVVYGIDESIDVTRTLDNTRPRTLADILFSDQEVFGKMVPEQRKHATRFIDHAIRLLWDRTGEKDDPYAPRRTHSEALNFLKRHPRLKRAVKHILDEDTKDKHITKFIAGGYAAGLLYLMGCSLTDGDVYRNSEDRDDKLLDWEMWDKAIEFWTIFANNKDSTLTPVRHALGALADPDTGLGGNIIEKKGIICKAWNMWVNKQKITEAKLKIQDERNADGIRKITEFPIVEGIDLGDDRGDDKDKKDVKENKVSKSKEVTASNPKIKEPVVRKHRKQSPAEEPDQLDDTGTDETEEEENGAGFPDDEPLDEDSGEEGEAGQEDQAADEEIVSDGEAEDRGTIQWEDTEASPPHRDDPTPDEIDERKAAERQRRADKLVANRMQKKQQQQKDKEAERKIKRK